MLSSIRNLLKGNSSINWLQPLPSSPPVNRREMILEACKGKRVIHLGFTDEYLTEEKEQDGRWLHQAISLCASSLVGLDIDENGVSQAVKKGYEAYVVDAQDREAIIALGLGKADVIVAGEIIEHVESPGHFLKAVKSLLAEEGELIITTPNAYRTVGVLAPILGEELIHPDHVGIHSIHTLRTLGERAGYKVKNLGYYQNTPSISPTTAAGILAKIVRGIQGRLLHRFPHWSDGIYAVYIL